MAAAFEVHEADGTSLGTIDARAASWSHVVAEDGSGRISGSGDIDAAKLAETVIVRINNGTDDIFAFVPTRKVRSSTDNPGESELDLSGPGVRWLLHAGQVLQEDTSDCAEPSGTRWLGWMSAAYDDSAWDTPISFGTHLSGPWETPRPEGWVDPLAEYIWTDEGAFGFGASPAGDVYFRKEFTTADEQDIVVCAAADDEFQLFVDGTEILSTLGGGAYQWQRFQQRPLKLCAGNHVIAIMGRNLARPVGLEGTNYGWVMASLMPLNGQTGEAQAADQKYAVYHDHTGGTFTLTGPFGATTGALAYNANASDVQTALEGLLTIGAGNVTVSGSGSVASPWMVEFGGDLSSMQIDLTANGASLTGGTAIEVDEHVRGGSGDPVVRTDTTWSCLPYPEDAPGLTPGELLRLGVEEAQDRGASVLDHFTFGFTDSLDSAGDAWDGELTIPLSLPADVHRLAVVVEEMGYPIEVTPTLVLECWNDRGTDLSATVTLAENTAGVTDVQATRDETTVANVVRYRAGDGWSERSDATSVTARGRWEAGISLDAFPSNREALAVVRPLVNDLATPPHTTTLSIPSEATVVPYDDFGLADIVTAPAFGTAGFVPTDMRVVSIGGRVEELSVVWSLELID